jgi:DNA-binding transcriptional regulator WhiA
VRRVHENHVVPEPRRGMANKRAKLTDDNVREIRRLYEIRELKHHPSAWNAQCRLKKQMHRKYTLAQLGKMFGVGTESIRRIVHRERWKHIE